MNYLVNFQPLQLAFSGQFSTGVNSLGSHFVSRVSARIKSGLSQSDFAKLLGVSVRTLQDWEQGRRQPSGAAKTLIAIAERRPDVLKEITV